MGKVIQMPKRTAMQSTVELAENDILTFKEAADFLKLKRRTLYYHVENGNIPFYKAGRLLRFSRRELLIWLSGAGHSANSSIA